MIPHRSRLAPREGYDVDCQNSSTYPHGYSKLRLSADPSPSLSTQDACPLNIGVHIMSTTSFPRLNEPAPDFKAKTTHGDRSLADYKGKWLILF